MTRGVLRYGHKERKTAMKNKKENPNLKSEELNEEELATISGGGDPGHRRIEPRLPNEEPKGKGPGKMPA